jgi:hypothetical protein
VACRKLYAPSVERPADKTLRPRLQFKLTRRGRVERLGDVGTVTPECMQDVAVFGGGGAGLALLGGSGTRYSLDPIIYRDARLVPSRRKFLSLRSFFELDLLKK